MKNLDQKTLDSIVAAQRNELTEHFIYQKLALLVKDQKNKEILQRISQDEKRHYKFWEKYSGKLPGPYKFKIWYYVIIAKVFGLTFGIKLMEKGEGQAQLAYEELAKFAPEAREIIDDEHVHENELINLIDEEKLKYVGSMVLGLNDALVELTGVLAGLTLALQNTNLIAMTGLVTGIAASLSMAGSEYLSMKAEDDDKNPLKGAFYTGLAYIFTVIILIAPYFIFSGVYAALAATLILALLIIFIFNFYISVAKDYKFKNRFFEMAGISLGVALISFGIGYVVRSFFNIDV